MSSESSSRPPLVIVDCVRGGAHSIAAHGSARQAADLMARLGVRHLPATVDGRIAGLVRQCDLHAIEALDPERFDALAVREVMGLDLLFVSPTALVATVVETMAEQRYDHAIVLEGKELLGVFTVTDALRLLAAELAPRANMGWTAAQRIA